MERYFQLFQAMNLFYFNSSCVEPKFAWTTAVFQVQFVAPRKTFNRIVATLWLNNLNTIQRQSFLIGKEKDRNTGLLCLPLNRPPGNAKMTPRFVVAYCNSKQYRHPGSFIRIVSYFVNIRPCVWFYGRNHMMSSKTRTPSAMLWKQ